MSSTPSGPLPSPAPVIPPSQGAKSNVVLWIVGIIVGVMLLCFGSCAVIGFYAMHKAKQAGLDSELMKKNPALATAKMAVMMNRDTELVSSDDDSGTIVVRDKKTGKTATMKFDPEKKSMVVIDENGKTATLTTTGEGANGGMEMKTDEGTVKVGVGADKAPDWVPGYPGASIQNTFSASKGSEQNGVYTFVTKDAVDKVSSYYGDSMKSAGFTVTNVSSNSDGKMGGMVSGEDKSNKRTIVVVLTTEDDGTHANVTYSVKQ